MDETRKLTAEEFEKVKNSGKYTQEQLEKIKDMEIPVNINELSDEQLENTSGGYISVLIDSECRLKDDVWEDALKFWEDALKFWEDAPKRSYTP
ncbi:MAG: hypothetical protein E7508_03860 [Ruminococcus sp.]|nr:hypothetical protein [Ruminococcus sp.]